jgi:hypothetical protein
MDRYKIHKTVEYIRTQTEFPFDGIDVEESLEEVLAYFGFHAQFDDEEREELRKDLLQLAVQAELAEMSRIVELGSTAGLDRVRDARHSEDALI